jgi:1,2-diacylglycerol 3-alpha-glucosyltransferase
MSDDVVSAGSNGAREGLHVAVLFHRLGAYHHARLRAAGELMRVTGIEFSNVDTTYDWEPIEGASGFKRVRLFSGEAVETMSSGRILKRVAEVLNEAQPQVVAVPGWSDRCSLAALWWCCLNRVPAVVMSDSTAADFQRTWLKESLKRRLLKLCASGLVAGRPQAEYLEKLGFSPKKIFLGYDVVDNHFFTARAVEIRSQATALRRQYSLPETYFLASARFVSKKNIGRLIEAYSIYRKQSEAEYNVGGGAEPWHLVLLGDGPLRDVINRQIVDLGLQGKVLTPGFKQYDQLPVYYALAKAFILASTTEQWGLVVNEAMASGLPVLVSDRCGCAADLVKPGVNGYCFDPYEMEDLAAKMFQCSRESTALAAMGGASLELISEWGVERFASGLAGAALAALKSPKIMVSIVDWLQVRLLLMKRGRISS